ncbi:MAG: hypothetical protein Q9223_006514 [Gallowayella weberi]
MAPPPTPLPTLRGSPSLLAHGSRRSTRIPKPTRKASSANEYETTASKSSSSRSSRKRRYSAMNLQQHEPETELVVDPASTEAASTYTGFSEATKNAIRAIEGEVCWHCGNAFGGLEFAHVLEAKERVVALQLLNEGKLNLTSLAQKENGIHLCTMCHTAFDAVARPGWVFYPANLSFFLNWERNDFHRRQRHFDKEGNFPHRAPPTIEQYKDQCSGLYNAVILADFGPQKPGGPAFFVPGPSICVPTAKAWHGDPMATLVRAFRVLGPNTRLFPPQLLELSELYQDNDVAAKTVLLIPNKSGSRPGPYSDGTDHEGPPIASAHHSTHAGGAPATQGPGVSRGRGYGGRSGGRGRGRGGAHTATRGAWTREAQTRETLIREALTPTRSSQKRQFDWSDIEAAQQRARAKVREYPWVWGPNATSEDRIEHQATIENLEWEGKRKRKRSTARISQQPLKHAANQKRCRVAGKGREGSAASKHLQAVYGGAGVEDQGGEGRIKDWLSRTS